MSEHEQINENHEHEIYGNCNQFLSCLGEYVDGALNPDLCTELERHMHECTRCRVVVDTIKKTVELYQEIAADTELPDAVRERLYVRLNLEDYLKK